MLGFRYWLGGVEFEKIRASREFFKDAGFFRFPECPERMMKYSVDDVCGEIYIDSRNFPDERLMALVSRVTAHDRFIPASTRIEGEYEWEGATALLEYEVSSDPFERGSYFVQYTAPTAEKIAVLSKKIRRGEIEPTVSYAGGQKNSIAEIRQQLDSAKLHLRELGTDYDNYINELETKVRDREARIAELENEKRELGRALTKATNLLTQVCVATRRIWRNLEEHFYVGPGRKKAIAGIVRDSILKEFVDGEYDGTNPHEIVRQVRNATRESEESLVRASAQAEKLALGGSLGLLGSKSSVERFGSK